MNYKYAFSSIIYSLGQITLGLLLHPYQTMQSLVEDKVFIWMSLLPTGVLAIAILGWRLLVVPIVRLVFSCQQTGFWGCELIPLFSHWLTFFCLYWQILLLYLLFRFSWVYKKQ